MASERRASAWPRRSPASRRTGRQAPKHARDLVLHHSQALGDPVPVAVGVALETDDRLFDARQHAQEPGDVELSGET